MDWPKNAGKRREFCLSVLLHPMLVGPETLQLGWSTVREKGGAAHG